METFDETNIRLETVSMYSRGAKFSALLPNREWVSITAHTYVAFRVRFDQGIVSNVNTIMAQMQEHLYIHRVVV